MDRTEATRDERPRKLAADEIDRRLAAMPDWSIVGAPAGDTHPRRELMRRFRFASFGDAMGFMQTAVPHIDAANHHPRWENVFRTVTVWLSTWEIGHVPGEKDFALAATLDALYAERTRAG